MVRDQGRGFIHARQQREVLAAPVADDIPRLEITSYPFFASAERAAAIRENFRRITTGMVPAEVAAILGKPDEIRPVYQPRYKQPVVIGHSHWYVIRRLIANGSVNDKQKSLVRIVYGLDDRVISVDAWGL